MRQPVRAQAHGLPFIPVNVSQTKINVGFFSFLTSFRFIVLLNLHVLLLTHIVQLWTAVCRGLETIASFNWWTQLNKAPSITTRSSFTAVQNTTNWKEMVTTEILPTSVLRLTDVLFISFTNVLPSTFQTHIYVTPVVNGYQWTARKGCQNVLKVGYCFSFHSNHQFWGSFLIIFVHF